MGLRHIQMEPLENPSFFRKLAMGNWGNIGDPQVYGILELDCEKALAYLEKLREKHQVKVTMTHLIGRIVALTWRKYPQLNGMISRGKIYIRKNVDMFFQVSMEDAETELVGLTIKNADQKGIVEFSEEAIEKAISIRASQDEPLRKTQRSFKWIPWKLMPHTIKLINWLLYDRNINLSWFGIPKDALGSVMVTSIGSIGLDLAFGPLNSIQRVPALIAAGKVHKKPVVQNDAIVIGHRINLCYTFDHRFIDGYLGSKMAKFATELLENIDQYEDLIEGRVALTN